MTSDQLKGIALQWIHDHGQRIYAGITSDIAVWAGTKLTEDEVDAVVGLIENSTVTVEF